LQGSMRPSLGVMAQMSESLLAQVVAVEILAAVYGLFLIYFILFRVVGGATLGQTWLRSQRMRAMATQRSPDLVKAPNPRASV